MRETMQYDNFVMKVLSTANTIGKILLTSGAETYRVEKAISTICRRFDLKAETFVTMTCVLTSAKKKDGATITEVNRIYTVSNNLDKVDRIHKILLDIHKYELEDLEGQSDDIASRLEQARHQNEELIRRQAKAEAEKDKLMDVMRRLASNLTDDYQMSFEEASSQARPLESLPAAESQVKDLEKAIRALGPVNLEAVEQFEEVSNRLNFLNEQRDDVLSAKNLLLETIEEMNDEVKERFKSTFEAIRESFKATFRQMFGGGSADLILTEGDLLTAGVEISVQPPGKKIQSLNLMSGGEKALSALALLFSIIRVKTIPFVILDEVEAALDEANVKRFGDYLNRFDKDSQFIVVTHRKGTMSAADSIYGVTMQESGVSKIVSVKLKDLESM